MQLDTSGDTLFFKRRVDGLDTLFVMQPDGRSAESPLALSATPGQLRFWAGPGGALAVAAPWPRADGGLKFSVYATERVRALVSRGTGDINALLTDVPQISEFTPEPRPLPEPVFARLHGDVLAVPGMSPHAGAQGDQGPAVYVMDGRNATSFLVPLAFLDRHALPNTLVDQPGSNRRWLTVGDSNHLFVLEGPEMALAGDVVWPAEQQGLARVAFHPTAPEAWVTAVSSVFVVDRRSLRIMAEIAVEDELRWHRGQRAVAAAGSVVFSADGARAWVARPYSGDVVELDTRTRKRVARVPMAVDAHELVAGRDRIFAQGLRNGAISWFPLPV